MHGTSDTSPTSRNVLLATLVVVVLALIAMSPALLADRIPARTDLTQLYGPWTTSLPSELVDILGGDSFFVYLPDRLVAVEQWRRGHLPLWNPHISMGVPLLGGQTANPLDPCIALWLALPAGLALGIQYALLLAVTGIGMTLFLRDRGITHPAALASGATAFMLCPYLLYWMELRVFLGGLAPMPLLLWAVERILKGTGSPREWVVGTLALGYSAVAGTLQTLVLVLALVVLRVAWVHRHQRSTTPSGITHGTRGTALLVLLGLGLGAISILSSTDLLFLSTRVGAKAGYYADSNFLPWRALGLWFHPGLFGWPPHSPFVVQQAFGRSLAGSSGWGASGVIPLGLALIALVTRSGPRSERLFWGALAIVPIALLLFLGTSPGRAAIALWPGLATVDLLRGLVLVNFALAVLAAHGAQQFFLHLGPRATRWGILWGTFALTGAAVMTATRIGMHAPLGLLPAIAPAMVLAALAGALAWAAPWGRWTAWGLPLLIAVELLTLHFRFNTFAPKETLYPSRPVLAEIRSRLGPPDYARFLVPGTMRVLPPNVPSVFALNDVRGYTNMPLARTRFMLESAEGRTLTNQVFVRAPDSPIYRSAAVGYAFMTPTFARKATHYAPEPLPGLRRGFMRRTDALPRAYLIHSLVAVPDRAALRSALADPDFDPSVTALIEADFSPPKVSPALDKEQVFIRSMETDRVAIRVEATAPGVLVLADAFHPGWRAEVNGNPTQIFPVNGGLRGIAVQPGAQEIVFRYHPGWLWPGTVITALAVLGLGVVAVGTRRGSKG